MSDQRPRRRAIPPGSHRAVVDVEPDAVRQARLEAGQSLAQVAGREMTRQAVHLIEHGKVRPRRRTMRIIARRLGVPIESLLAKPSLPGVTAVIDGEQITIRRDGVDILGIDLEAGAVGTWPDGETWVRIALLPHTLPICDPRTPAERRIGTEHEETIRDGRSHCTLCGWVDEADPTDPIVRRFHGDSFEEPEEEVEELVLCFFCREECPLSTAQSYRGSWVGECCWDERLRSSQ